MENSQEQKSTISYFYGFFVFLIIATIIEVLYAGMLGLYQGAVLSVLELSLSFDNAVLNALILQTMTHFWRRAFITWGMLIAVFGMRLVFPILIVDITTDLNFIESFQLAISNPVQYEAIIASSHHIIMSFGSSFLVMIFLTFLFNEEKDIHWIGWIERHASRWASVGDLKILTVLLMIAVVGYFAPTQLTIHNKIVDIQKTEIILPMIYGVILFLAIEFLKGILEDDGKVVEESEKDKIANVSKDVALKGGIASFLYIEMIDMSLSFDGVLAAFAISQNVIIIMLGLGVGAMGVRSLTLLMVDRNTVTEYKYLEHGAMWSIGLLAICMLYQVFEHLPGWVVTTVAVLPISIAFVHSIMENRRENS
jgi:hypothetical protein